MKTVCSLAVMFCSALLAMGWAAAADDVIVIEVASADNADPFEAGKAAAVALQKRMGAVKPHAVIMAECFEEESLKQAALKGVASVFAPESIYGCATYGSFEKAGCFDLDSVTLIGIGGDGIAVSAALMPKLDITGLSMEENLDLLTERLHKAGAALVKDISKSDKDQLLIVMADAHSPKNQFLVEGLQQVLGADFPITGGSANKNVGQTFVYHEGKAYQDAAVALMLSGDFKVALAGRQAKDNDAVISSAGEAAAEAKEKLGCKPIAALAFNCGGRKGKLDKLEDELAAIQGVIGQELPMFGCYCAGEIGPADASENKTDALSSGVGWHIMFTLLGR
jgi:hypothetical protein